MELPFEEPITPARYAPFPDDADLESLTPQETVERILASGDWRTNVDSNTVEDDSGKIRDRETIQNFFVNNPGLLTRTATAKLSEYFLQYQELYSELDSVVEDSPNVLWFDTVLLKGAVDAFLAEQERVLQRQLRQRYSSSEESEFEELLLERDLDPEFLGVDF